MFSYEFSKAFQSDFFYITTVLLVNARLNQKNLHDIFLRHVLFFLNGSET